MKNYDIYIHNNKMWFHGFIDPLWYADLYCIQINRTLSGTRDAHNLRYILKGKYEKL